MGSVFRQQVTKPLPSDAEIVTKKGRRFARWRVRGKTRSARLTIGSGGVDRILTEARTFTARYRDHTGNIVTRPTGCRDEQTARQLLAKWEREAEQIKAGTLDAKTLDAAKKAAAPLEDHLAAYERSLVAGGVTAVYRANLIRAVRRVSAECGFGTPADFDRERVEGWLAERITGPENMSARNRNHYRQSLIAFANWCVETGRLIGHDLARVPKADEKADPRRQRRALTEDELKRLLAVAAIRPLTDARTVRRGEGRARLSPNCGTRPSHASGPSDASGH